MKHAKGSDRGDKRDRQNAALIKRIRQLEKEKEQAEKRFDNLEARVNGLQVATAESAKAYLGLGQMQMKIDEKLNQLMEVVKGALEQAQEIDQVKETFEADTVIGKVTVT